MVAPSSSAHKGKKRAASPSRPSSSAPKKAKADASTSASAQQPFKSALVSEEVDFPRGGGSGLTPLEYKEVLGEGRREADAAVAAEGAAAAVSPLLARAMAGSMLRDPEGRPVG